MKNSREILAHLLTNPSLIQASQQNGLYKGIVVNNKDEAQLGRAQVYSYCLHGDAKNLSIESLPWCELFPAFRGAFAPPELFDRVIISFEVGDKYAPVICGYWNAIPAGRGGLPHSSRNGTEIRPENWHHHGLTPETIMLACSGAGNAIWFEDKLLGENLASVVQLEDTGGRIIRARSFHLGFSGYAAVDEIDKTKGGLLKVDGESTPARNGVDKAPQVAGVIELAQQNVSRKLISSKDKFSVDSMLQLDSSDDIGVSVLSVAGEMHQSRVGKAAIQIAGDIVALMSARGAVVSPLYTPPRIW